MDNTNWSEISNRIYEIANEIKGVGDLVGAVSDGLGKIGCSDGLLLLARVLWDSGDELNKLSQEKIKNTKADNSAKI